MSSDEGRADQEHVGSLREEAARLVGALSGWFTHVGGDLGEGVEDVVEHVRGAASHAVHDLEGHLATGAPECRFCPVCRTLHVLREVTPEVRAHLADAATSLAQAALGLAAALATEGARGSARSSTAPGAEESAHGGAPPGVQHIDLDLDPQPDAGDDAARDDADDDR